MAVTTKEELKVDTEIADGVDQTGWTYTYSYDKTKGTYVTPKGQEVRAEENFKTTEIRLGSFERPHMRGFHCASSPPSLLCVGERVPTHAL